MKVSGIQITIRDLVNQIEEYFSVETKDGNVVPFNLNNKQNQLLNGIEKVEKPVRVLILKGRQFGFSTLILALFFVKCLVVNNTRAVVISHTEDATKKLFRRVKFFANTLTAKPVLDKESEREFTFPETNSYFYIGTAGTKTFGRGDNITDLHCSEVGVWKNAGTVMNGLLQAVGMSGNVFIETTANGYGNYLHRLWQKSWKKISTWTALFFSWIDFEEYEKDVEPNFERTEDETELVNKHLLNLSEEKANRKLSWRRWKIAETETEKGFTPEEIFQQEYPFTPEEAFLATGNSYFNKDRIIELIQKAEPPLEIGDIILNPNNTPSFLKNREGRLKIWEYPEKYHYYVIGGDVGEGKSGGDFSVLNVIDNYSLKTVAKFKARIRPDEFAKIGFALGKWYNNAYIAIENNSGLWTLTDIWERGYENLYFTESIDRITKNVIPKLGFNTNEKTRKPLLDNLLALLNKFDDIWTNEDLLQECLVFVRNESGRPEAMQGENDDEIFATAICYFVRENASSDPEIPKQDKVITTVGELVEARLNKLYGKKQQSISQQDYL